jgi:hypothetical protein
MALAITGDTGAYAPSTATTKSAATGSSHDGGAYPTYTFTDAGGRSVKLRQISPGPDGPGTVSLGNSAAILEFAAGGQQGESLLRLTRQNVIDLISTGLLSFANTGVLS